MNELALSSPRRFLLALALIVVAFPLRAADAPARATTLFVVRHAEKAPGDGDVPLSPVGRERAALLARTLKDAQVTRVFTSQMARARETATPLAEALKLTSEVVPAQDPDALVTALRALPRGTTALIVGHSNTVPVIVERVAGTKVQPIAEDEFDRLLVLTIGDGSVTVTTLRYGPKP